MPRRTTPLTDVQVRNEKPKKGKQVTLFDGGGLYLLVKPSGDKGWRLKYRFNSKNSLMSLGPYPQVSLSEAREKRLEVKKLIASGISPIAERAARKLKQETTWENTFEKVALEWHEKQTDLADTTKKLHMRRLIKDIFPTIGSLPITELTPRTILEKVLRPMENRGVGEMTARVKSIIAQACRYGVACGYLDRDPTTDLTGALKKVERGHRAAFTEPTKLAALLRAIDDYDGYLVVKCALQLAPLVFVRPGELRSMKWANIDFEAAEWRYFISKTKTEHIVPLPTQALAILGKLKPVTGHSIYVFPSVRSVARPISNNTLNAALRRMGFTKDEVSVHGFRATARTILEEVLQERVEYIEHQLAHSVKDPLGRAYNRTKHLDQRRRMMQVWADYLEQLRGKHGIL